MSSKKTKKDNEHFSIISHNLDRHALITNANDYVIITNNRDKIEWVNEGFTRITGYKLWDVIGHSPAALLRGTGTDAETRKRIDEKAKQRIPFRDQILNYDKKGDPIWLSLNVIPVFSPKGEFEKFVTIGSDITYVKIAETELRNKGRKLLLLNTISSGLLQSDSFDKIFETAISSLFENYENISRISASLFDFKKEEVNFFIVKSKTETAVNAGHKFHFSDFESIKYLQKKGYRYVKSLSKTANISTTDRILLNENIESYIVLPLLKNKQLIGSLNVSSYKANAFLNEQIETFIEVCNLLSVSINQADLKKELEDKSNELIIKNKEITDSIKYAKHIQEAILPEKKLINKLLPDSFFLFLPKDIVSGDFYWVAERNDKVFFTAADCTGHGVPGAFMSMIGSSLLNQIVMGKKISSANEILNELRTKIILLLKQKGIEGEQKDGMDAAFCVWDRKKHTLEYAGAHNPILIIRKANVPLIDFFGDNAGLTPDMEENGYFLYEITADRQPISIFGKEMKPFTNHEFKLMEGDTIYILSDGYTDQFGGEKGKKFMLRRLKKLLLSIQNKLLKEQEQIIKAEFYEWKGALEQVDDVIIGCVRF